MAFFLGTQDPGPAGEVSPDSINYSYRARQIEKERKTSPPANFSLVHLLGGPLNLYKPAIYLKLLCNFVIKTLDCKLLYLDRLCDFQT